LLIEIFGLGCENCERLKNNVQKAIEELGAKAQIVKVEDLEALIRKGITVTPGLVIDNEIRSMGRVPSVEEIKEMIGTAGKEQTTQRISDNAAANPTCGCSTTGTMFYACSGGSNVGQLSNDVAKAAVGKVKGKFSCLAGVGSGEAGFIASAKKADRVVILDGCAVRCAYKILKNAGIEQTIYLIITELGISKNYDQLNPSQEDVDKILSLLENDL
jgi:small redox-active disulfide protein 2